MPHPNSAIFVVEKSKNYKQKKTRKLIFGKNMRWLKARDNITSSPGSLTNGDREG
jgi:hypothetical protein